MPKKQPENFDSKVKEIPPAEELSSILEQDNQEPSPQIQAQVDDHESRITNLEKAMLHLIRQQPKVPVIEPEIIQEPVKATKEKKPEQLPAWQQKAVNPETPETPKKKKFSTWKVIAVIVLIAVFLYIISNWSAIMSYFG